MSAKKKESIRFRLNSGGAQVMVSNKWVPADDLVMTNIYQLLLKLYGFKSQY